MNVALPQFEAARTSLAARVRHWLHQSNGALTDELTLQPARFSLGLTPAHLQPDAITTAVCGFCSTGCGLHVHMHQGEAINISPATTYPVNLGAACPKGWEALSVLRASDRAVTPLARNHRGRLAPVDWDAALRTFCERFQQIQQKHGPESVAFLSTGQIATEEMALLGSLAKFGMGMLHGDGNTRQCMATSVVAYKQSFGFDAPPYTYADLEESDVIVLVGSNLCIAHPILWQRIVRNRHRPEILVVDPRRTETAMAATQHLALRPKSDMVLFYGIAQWLVEQGHINSKYIQEHTSGFEEFRAHLAEYPLSRVVKETGLDEAVIRHAAQTIASGKRVSFWWTMGVNQSYQGVRTAQCLINLALMTGNLGRPGTGANSITGQCNAMGSRLFSNTTNLLGGHDFTNAAHRKKIAKILDINEARIPDQNSWAYPEIIEGILRGKIKGLWVIATNPAHSWINQQGVRDILSRLDFLVVQDMYHSTETAQIADLVLPAAGWGEKEGTFINSERRIGLLKKVSKAPGQALSDFSIFRLVAQYWGCGEMFSRWTSPEAVFHLLKKCSRGQPCDITGIRDYRMLDESGGIQWPFPEGVTEDRPERRLFEDGRFLHPDGRARFFFEAPHDMPEPPNARYPLLLITGRGTAAQWHTQTRTDKSEVLRTMYPRQVYVEINPHDAKQAGVKPNQPVVVESARGRIKATAFVTATAAPGQVFMPMHYEETNKLTHAHFDPYSRQPSYKDSAVNIRPLADGDVDL
jgi:assimilatory nitrate reductase catalytic subunit